MRNFDETMNEIRSRSKARIVKRRKQIQSVCMSLILCVTMGCLWILPVNRPGDTAFTQPATMPNSSNPDVIDVTNQQNIEIRCSAETSEKMFAFLNGMRTDSTRETHTATYQTTHAQDASKPLRTYTVTLTDGQGSTKVFLLQGMILQDLQTSTVYALNSAQYQKLYKLLGLDRIVYEID